MCQNNGATYFYGGKEFERGLEELGTALGYKTGNPKRDGDPDPWWQLGSQICIVSEAKIYQSEDKATVYSR